MKTYQGNVEIIKDNQKEWEKKLKDVEKITGFLSINSNAELRADKLESVGGDLSIYSNPWLEKQLWKHCKKNKWHVTEKSSGWLIEKYGNFVYRLNNVEFEREWFDKIRKDQLTAEEVFAIDNIEHRRVAYEFMDKTKMKEIKDFKILDEVKDDGKGNPMKIVSFTVQKMNEPLKFLNCFCPSTGREYFLGTDKDKCWPAKMASFGLPEDRKFDLEF